MFRYCVLLLALLGCFMHDIMAQSSGFIKAGDYHIYYEQLGKGNPVLLVHAGLQEHSMWDQQVKAISKKYKVITIDLPYHGRSTGYDTSLLAKDVVRIVLDNLHINKTAIVGLSMGAAITEDFIIAYPERVSKAVLISAGINGYENHFPIDSFSMSWYPSMMAALQAKDTVKAALVFTSIWSEGMTAKGNRLSKPASKYVYATTLKTLKQHRLISWPNLENNPPAMERISDIKLPVLIIHGDQDIPIIDATSKYLEKTIKGSRRILFKNVAHMLNLEKPQQLNGLLLSFLGSVK